MPNTETTSYVQEKLKIWETPLDLRSDTFRYAIVKHKINNLNKKNVRFSKVPVDLISETL